MFPAVGLAHAINQNGLSAPYVSGTTDFDTYVASTTHVDSGFSNDFIAEEAAGVIDLDLGSVQTVTGIALWNGASTDAWRNFEVFRSPDNTFSSLTSLGSFTAVGNAIGPVPAQTFVFSNTGAAQFVRVQLITNFGGSDSNLREIAFDSVIPEPCTAWLSIVAALVVMGSRRKHVPA